MQDAEQVESYAMADFEAPHSAFIDHFRQCFPDYQPGSQETVCDLGCGPGDITRRFAKAFASVHIDAMDGSQAMIDYGRKFTMQSLPQAAICFRCVLLPDPTLPTGHYSLIISNSLLHHISRPEHLWQTIWSIAQPSAKVFLMDLRRPESVNQAQIMVDCYAKNEPEILRHDFYHSLLAAYTLSEVRKQLEDAALSDLQCAEIGDRHLIVWGQIEKS